MNEELFKKLEYYEVNSHMSYCGLYNDGYLTFSLLPRYSDNLHFISRLKCPGIINIKDSADRYLTDKEIIEGIDIMIVTLKNIKKEMVKK